MVEQFKQEGNKQFKEQKYSLAAALYSNAIQGAGDALRESPTVLACLNNRAMCYLKLEQYENCARDVERVLVADPENHKARVRYAMALEKLGKVSQALKQAELTLELEPDMNSAIEIRDRLAKLVKHRSSSVARFSLRKGPKEGTVEPKAAQEGLAAPGSNAGKGSYFASDEYDDGGDTSKRFPSDADGIEETECKESCATALYDYEGVGRQGLSFTKGEKMIVLAIRKDGWFKGRNMRGSVGYFPGAYVSTKDVL
jgi:tetratricopeptide (TPR) repeat protein